MSEIIQNHYCQEEKIIEHISSDLHASCSIVNHIVNKVAVGTNKNFKLNFCLQREETHLIFIITYPKIP